jgi:hypothetical protein
MKAKNNAKEDSSITPEQIMQKLHFDLNYWQRELRIENIDIELRWLSKEEAPDKFALSWPYLELHYAVLAFQLPQNCLCMIHRSFNSDYEVVLVHELLHVRDSNWRSSEIRELLDEEVTLELYEISIDAVAEALVRARRGMKR